MMVYAAPCTAVWATTAYLSWVKTYTVTTLIQVSSLFDHACHNL